MIQVWNEPNLPIFGSIPPSRYLELLRLAVEAVGEQRIIGAGLAPLRGGPGRIDFVEYARELRHAGVAGVDHDVALHIFPGKVGGLDYVRKARVAYGCDTQLWVTEMGPMPGSKHGVPLSPSREREQARLIRRVLPALTGMDGIAGIIVYRLIDDPGGDFLGDASTGLLRADGTPKPALGALREAIGAAEASSYSESCPSNRFRFGRVERNRKRGTAKLTVRVRAPGRVKLRKARFVRSAKKRAVVRAGGKRRLKLLVRPRRPAKSRLRARGKAKVSARVRYVPDGGAPRTKRKRIRLLHG